MSEPKSGEVRFARTREGLNIAYTVRGDGPPLVFVRALNSHVERMWHEPWKRMYFGSLARAFRVVTFDARGNGLSDQPKVIDLEGLVEDVRAVIEDAELEVATIYGQGFGSPVAIAYATRYPESVARLILYCAYASGLGLAITDSFIHTMRTSPEAALPGLLFATYPDLEAMPARLVRDTAVSVRPEIAAEYLEFARSVDVRGFLAQVSVPTLVLQPEGYPAVPSTLGREVAEGIEGALYESIPGRSYNPWAEAAVEPTLMAIGEFADRSIPLMSEPRPMSVLVTDLVGSTEMTHRLGEERARDLFHDHDAIVRDARRRYRGKEVKHTGDGIMIRFDESAAAVGCATAIQERVADRNESLSDDPIHVRVGVVFGEVVEERDGLFGTTVALAVRIMDQADAGQVLVSESVCVGLGSEFAFGPARNLVLKGFPERVAVHELHWTPK